MILMIDNYDSFTYNVVQYFGELGAELTVHRNDMIDISEIEKINPEKIVISPGPCTPNEAGVSVEVVKRFYKTKPILGAKYQGPFRPCRLLGIFAEYFDHYFS